jgi:hypothetical protein
VLPVCAVLSASRASPSSCQEASAAAGAGAAPGGAAGAAASSGSSSSTAEEDESSARTRLFHEVVILLRCLYLRAVARSLLIMHSDHLLHFGPPHSFCLLPFQQLKFSDAEAFVLNREQKKIEFGSSKAQVLISLSLH